MSKPTLLFDYDPVIYAAASVGETRSVKVVHTGSGDEVGEFSSRTAFYGHHGKKAGGYLAEWNAAKSEGNRRLADEFTYTDVQIPEPLPNVLHTAKQIITGVKEAVGANLYYGYSGKGKVFREDVSTVLMYKGTRIGKLRPVLLPDVQDYIVRNHACTIIGDIEADDACSIDLYTAHRKWLASKSEEDKKILAFVDKDAWGCEGFLYNTNDATGVVHNDGSLGKLWIVEKVDAKGKKTRSVKGIGMIWLYHQVMSGDDADNYCANSANPDFKWGEMASYELLKDCKTHKQAWEALVKGYKTIYPTSRKIIGWRGYSDPGKRTILKPDYLDYEIEVDAMYVLQENFTLARMLRHQGDFDIKVTDVCDKLGVKY